MGWTLITLLPLGTEQNAIPFSLKMNSLNILETEILKFSILSKAGSKTKEIKTIRNYQEKQKEIKTQIGTY